MFTVAISRLITSSLPWFMDLTFQVPMQYCSLQHWTLFSLPDTSTTEYHFHFGPATPLFLELIVTALHSSPVVYWTASDLGRLIFGCHIFLPFHTDHEILTARILEWFAFLLPVDHVLSELFTMTRLSQVALHSMAHSFIELCKPLLHNKAVIHEGDVIVICNK